MNLQQNHNRVAELNKVLPVLYWPYNLKIIIL